MQVASAMATTSSTPSASGVRPASPSAREAVAAAAERGTSSCGTLMMRAQSSERAHVVTVGSRRKVTSNRCDQPVARLRLVETRRQPSREFDGEPLRRGDAPTQARVGVRAQHLRNLRRGQRRARVEALDLVAAELLQEPYLGVLLHAFGDDLEAQG